MKLRKGLCEKPFFIVFDMLRLTIKSHLRKSLIIGLVIGSCLGQSPFARAEIDNAFAKKESVYVYTDLRVLSPVTEITELEKGWQGNRSGNYAQAQMKAGSDWVLGNGFVIGVQRRLDYLVHFDRATSDFYAALEQSELPEGQYPLNLEVNAAKAEGFKLGYFIPLSNFVSLSVSGYLWSGDRVQQGSLSGLGEIGPNQQISYEYQLDYAYDEQRILDGDRFGVSAWGHSFDVELEAKNRLGTQLELGFYDLYYRLYWEAVGLDNGCLVRPLIANPSCSVFSDKASFDQSLSSSSVMAVKQDLAGLGALGTFEGYSLSARYEAWSRYAAYWVGAEANLADTGLAKRVLGGGLNGEISAAYELKEDLLALGYESQRLKVEYRFDDLSFSSARFAQFTLDVFWPL